MYKIWDLRWGTYFHCRCSVFEKIILLPLLKCFSTCVTEFRWIHLCGLLLEFSILIYRGSISVSSHQYHTVFVCIVHILCSYSNQILLVLSQELLVESGEGWSYLCSLLLLGWGTGNAKSGFLSFVVQGNVKTLWYYCSFSPGMACLTTFQNSPFVVSCVISMVYSCS